MRDVSMDDGAITMEGAEACQGELAVEDGSVSNRAVDADRAQARGAEKVIGAQGIQVAGGNGSVVSGGIATEDLEAVAEEEEIRKNKVPGGRRFRGRTRGGQQRALTGAAQKKYGRQREPSKDLKK